ncbi:MAG: hypothetical protein E6K78_07575 [Candidatus Eisenbacteria bacterium]|uniref:Uncharacterized protein n=1 Tax=Eiseniibacteriota bacterium TaxID=2212470 RepID=A0A538TPB4_UNCEI|nr:MAG: hypothetical protein E6K78_07575 [Candidatus Eisenbacteria bacterium]
MRRAALFVAALLAARVARAEPLEPVEPPPEAPEGSDYTVEPADSIAGGDFEFGFGAAGTKGSAPRPRRRLSFDEGGLRGTVREGTGDPLAGGLVEERSDDRAWLIGRLAPRWGRGLLLGSPADPWQGAAADRGAGAAFRGRSGQGVLYRRGHRSGLECVAGRFARRDLAGLLLWHGGLAMGFLAGRGRQAQGSVAFGDSGASSELALDGKGRWRAEGLLARRVSGSRLTARARGGHPAFRSLAEPLRSGPAQALAVRLVWPTSRASLGITGALWRFRAGRAGARLAGEVERHQDDRSIVALGLEEQHGPRRDTPSPANAFRQGAWGEFRRVATPLALSLRHEAWGDRAILRGGARVVTTVRLEASGPFGWKLAVTHSVFRSRRGESLYLAEGEIDRLVLRAVSGEGERSRIELRLPAAGGRLTGGLQLVRSVGRAAPVRWSLDWSRRGRRDARDRP